MLQLIDKTISRIDFKHIIALVIVGFAFWILKLVLFSDLPVSADKYASQIITGIMQVLTMVLGFWFISSSSAAKKDATIASMIPVPGRSISLDTSDVTNTTTTVLTLTWLGSFDSNPGNPAVNDAYVNTTDNKSYYWDGTIWQITTQTPNV